MEFHLFKADASRLKWSVRGTLYNGVDVKIPGHRDKRIAQEMCRNIARLNLAKGNNEPPPAEVIEWLDNQPPKFVNRLIDLKLVDQRRLDRLLPLETFLPEFEEYLKGNAIKQTSSYPKTSTARVRRILRSIKGLNSFDELTAEAVRKAVSEMIVLTATRKGKSFSVASIREHYSSIKQFCDWMTKKGRYTVNPLEELELPSSKNNRVRNRRPLSYENFTKLMNYLLTAKKYHNQQYLWDARDRAMIYWAAVSTGFRQNELFSLTRASFNFSASPVTLTISAQVAKNGCGDTIPIPDDFAEAINEYTAQHSPNQAVFRAPRWRKYVRWALYRDLDQAGVQRHFDNGDLVDFHTFRSTAICWWLRSGLKLLDVQYLARLKTLALVQEYVRRYVPDHRHLVNNLPKIVGPDFTQRLSG